MIREFRTSFNCLFIFLCMFGVANAKEWRGIVPLHSTCEDVKRLLGPSSCKASYYDLKDETVFINYSEKPCDERLHGGWNVPPGTVINISVNPKKPPTLAELHIDESKYKKSPSKLAIGNINYTNEEEGFDFTLFPDGKVRNFVYWPAARDNHLRCRLSSDSNSETDEPPNTLPKFDEYGDISFEDEKKHLNDFAVALREMFDLDTQGYIIVYGGRHSRSGEVQMRAERAKNYLINICGIDTKRIVTVEGGYKTEVTTELWFRPAGVAAPKP
jgi:hypothetical protein